MEYHGVDLRPGKEIVLADITGPGKDHLLLLHRQQLPSRHGRSGAIYAGLVLKVYWDDAAEPSIRVPLWAFFGVFDHKAIDYQSRAHADQSLQLHVLFAHAVLPSRALGAGE